MKPKLIYTLYINLINNIFKISKNDNVIDLDIINIYVK